jgi:hypothetical protein
MVTAIIVGRMALTLFFYRAAAWKRLIQSNAVKLIGTPFILVLTSNRLQTRYALYC